MAIYRMQTRIAQDTPSTTPYKWSYLWYVDAADLSAAVAVGEALWAALRPAHSNYAYCYELYITDLVPSTTNFVTSPITAGNQRGTAGLVTNLLPSFNVARIDLNVVGSRPSRKFQRLPLGETQIQNGVLEDSASDTFREAYLDAIAIPGIVDESGNGFVGVTVKGVTSRRLGKFAYTGVPNGPALG